MKTKILAKNCKCYNCNNKAVAFLCLDMDLKPLPVCEDCKVEFLRELFDISNSKVLISSTPKGK